MSSRKQNAGVFLAWMLFAIPVWTQTKVGDLVTLGLNGNVGVGYNADFGNAQSSDHSIGLNGQADLNGSYYNPNFINFHSLFFLNRSQANSGNGSITDASSISAGVGIFGGSHFPGSVSFSKSFNSSGIYGLPGLPGYSTHGDSTGFGIGWAEVVPGLPPLSVQFSDQHSNSSLFGTSEQDETSTESLNMQSSYRFRGWSTSGHFTDIHVNTHLPTLLNGESDGNDESTKSLTLLASHRLPLQGMTSFTYGYSTVTGTSGGTSVSSSNSTFSGSASFVPVKRLSSTFGIEYDSSLAGEVEQQLATAGSVASPVNLGAQSRQLSMYNFDSLSIYKNLNASFSVTHVQQEIYGQSLAVNHFSAVVNYNFLKPFLGSFTLYGGVNDQSTEDGHQGTGLTTGLNFDRVIKRSTDVGGNFGYSQNVQTVLVDRVTSNYTYMAWARHVFTRHLRWNNSFSGYHTGLGQIEGSSSHSEGYSSSLQYRSYAFTGNYGKSSGTALITPTGLVTAPVTILPVLSGNQYLLASGTSYGFSASANPIEHMSLVATYGVSKDTTVGPSLFSTGSAKTLSVYTQYQLRKLFVSAGITRLMQGIGTATAGTTPATFSSYYFGIQRWFNFF